MEELTAEHLYYHLIYNPETGLFFWRNPIGRKMKAGDIAGWKSDRYMRITIHGKKYISHRLAFLYMEGRWPEKELDHINVDGFDNRWCNIREATGCQNQLNRGPQKNNTSGAKGVYKRRNRWMASITVNSKRHYLGLFDTVEKAQEAYKKAALGLCGQFAKW